MTSHASSSPHWDQRYESGDAPWDSGIVSQELLRVLHDEHVATCHAVELGCGAGTNAVHLAQQGFDVLAADFSAVAIERARSLATQAGVAVEFAVSDLCRVSDLQAALQGSATIHERQCSFLFDRGCYHCARKTNLAGFRQTVAWLAAPNAQMLLLCGNANEPTEKGPPKLTSAEIRADWNDLFEMEWLREFRFEDRGGVPGPLGWACFMRRRLAE